MTDWLHALDYWSYQFIAAVWGMYWPTFLIIAAFTVAERLFPLEKNLPWRAVRFNLAWQVFALSAFVALSWSAWGDIFRWLYGLAGRPIIYVARSDSWLIESGRILLIIAVNDLLLYWVHRLSHAVPALWMVHRFHHNEEHLHAATMTRQHWLSFPIAQVLLLPTVWLWGGDAVPQTVVIVVTAIAVFHHSNLRLGLGRLTPIIVGPQLHRLHHARDRANHDSNFAGVFPLWDIVFGTYRAPRPGEFGATGLATQKPSSEYWRSFFQPLVDWWAMATGVFKRK